MKETAAKGMNELKEKVSFSRFFRRIGHTVSSLFSSLGRGIAGIGGPLKSFLLWLFRFIKLAVILLLLLFAEFIFLCITGLFTFASISFLGIGIFGILAFICTFSFISVFFSASGILSSIAVTCAGLLCGLLVVFLISKNVRLIKSYLSGKQETQKKGGEDYV